MVRITDAATDDLHGTVRLNADGTLRFSPEPGFNGPLSFTYTISDGDATDTATVNLTVDSINDPPIAEPDLVSGPEDTVLTFDPRANDADPENDPLTITADQRPADRHRHPGPAGRRPADDEPRRTRCRSAPT